MKKTIYLALLFLAVLQSQLAQATKYFISTTGNDANTGTTATTAWKSIARANQAQFQPGDYILFEAGGTYAGSFYLHGAGTAAQPIKITSYGAGTATINGGNTFGLYVLNAGGIEVKRLNFVGSGRMVNTTSGVIFNVADIDSQLEYLRLDSVQVSGYQGAGIVIGSYNGQGGYRDVRITNCQVHDNGLEGIHAYADGLKAHRNWYIGDCVAYNNPGRPDITQTNTGSGIVVGGIDNVVIEHCKAYGNGSLNACTVSGPAGIWAYNCNNLVIQECEAYDNQSGTLDGGGFDIDGGCTNAILQYNYSHNNNGPGYLISQYGTANPLHDVTIRYNISENDARNYAGAITLWSTGANGGIQRANIYNNTIYMRPTITGYDTRAVYIMSNGISESGIYNNILQTSGGVPVLVAQGTSGVSFRGNCYWATEGATSIKWGGTSFSAVDAWQQYTQQEMMSGRGVALVVDPLLVAPGTGGSTSTVEGSFQHSLSAYQLQADSPVRGKGLNLAELGIALGPRDFYGLPTPATGSVGNVGAYEGRSKPLPVTLIDFKATRHQANQAMLHWQTASETNSAYFAVERSEDGRVFTTSAQLAAQGNSHRPHSYAWTDPQPLTQTTYYRLRQVDEGGALHYSPVATVSPLAETTGAPQILAYPNPGQRGQVLRVALQGSRGAVVQLRVSSLLGKTVLTQKASLTAVGRTDVPLALPATLPAGVYLLSVEGDEASSSKQVKLVLQ